MDSGASEHMIKEKNLLFDIKETNPRIIFVGDGRKIQADESGSLDITLPTAERKLGLTDAIYVPQLDTNLIFCSALDRSEYVTELMASV